jgi:hypothetical protein
MMSWEAWSAPRQGDGPEPLSRPDSEGETMSDVFDKQSVSTALAHRIVSAADAKASELAVPMVIAVCESPAC